MTDIRHRLVLILVLIFGTIAIIVVSIIFFAGPKNTEEQIEEPVQNEQVQEQLQQNNGQQGSVVEEVIPPQNSDEVYAKQTARNFVERFATYSNQNENRHINDVLYLVTDSMALWVKQQALEYSMDYEGVTTVVLASSVISKTNSTITVEVDARQTKETVDTREVTARSGRIDLVKVNNVWKVDGFYWD
jgi:hypothetical protein